MRVDAAPGQVSVIGGDVIDFHREGDFVHGGTVNTCQHGNTATRTCWEDTGGHRRTQLLVTRRNGDNGRRTRGTDTPRMMGTHAAQIVDGHARTQVSYFRIKIETK